MSNNLYQQSINILNKASSASTEAERNRLYDQANEIFRNPNFVKSYQPSSSSNNSYSGLTSSPVTYNGYSVNSGLTSIPTTTTSTPYLYQNGWYVDYKPGGNW